MASLVTLALLAGVLVFGTGCSGVNASGSVSPATFLLPGLSRTGPSPAQHSVERAPAPEPVLVARAN